MTLEVAPWWEAEGGEQVARLVFETVKDIERRQQSIHDGHRRHARIYAGYTPAGLAWGDTQGVRTREPHEVTRSVVRSVCDTATALISKFRPKPTFVTDGADWSVQRMAQDLDRFMVGAYEVGDVYPVSSRAFHDSTVFGTGAWKLVPCGKGKKFKVRAEHVLIDDLIVDEDECREHLDPVNVYHRVPMRADALIKRYASGNKREDIAKKMAIEAAKGRGGAADWPGSRYVKPSHCMTVEAFHINEDGVGRRVLCVNGMVLEDTPWKFPWHPFVILHWAPPLSGFYGDGIAYRQFGRQQRITYLYRWIQRCHDLFATPRAWVDPAGGPPTLQLSNEIGSVIMSRRPPVFQTQQVVPPEVYTWLNNLESGTFEDEGISQASAANTLPKGLESAPAQREYSFKESSRFAPVSQRWEEAVAVENAKKMVAMYRAAAEESDEKPTMAWATRSLREIIEWDAASLDEDAYQIRSAASSLDSLSPAARMQAAIELSGTPMVSPVEARSLMGHPDLEKSDELASAPRRFAEWTLQRLLRGEVVAVDEYADLLELRKVIQNGYLLAAQRKAPQKILQNLQRYLDDLTALEPAPPTAAPPLGMAPPGMAGPMMPPALGDPAAQGMPMPLPGGPI